MAYYILSRDHASTVSLVSTLGKAVFLSKDGEEVNVPLAPLLGASTLLRSVVAESHLHPGVHGPLVLSLSVATDILASVGEIFGKGESNVKEENIKEVQQVLNLIGVEANLSKIRRNYEYYENVPTSEEGVYLEIELEPIEDEEKDFSEGGVSEAKNNSLRDCYVNVQKLAKYPGQSDPNNKKGTETTDNNDNIFDYSTTVNEEDIKLAVVFESISDEDADLCVVGVNEAKDDSYGQCDVKVENLVVFPDPKYPNNKTETEEDEHKCNLCDYSAVSESNLKVHRRCHNVSNRSVLEKSNIKYTIVKQHTCNICNKSFSTKSVLRVHSRIHTGEKPFTCQICNKSFSNKSHLHGHTRIHTGEKPYTCNICNKSFPQKYNLHLHSRIHTGEKPFTCRICNKSFSQKSNLQDHSRIHTGEKPFTCKICNKSFDRAYHLHEHSRIHTGEKPFTCQICGKSFSSKSNLHAHSRIHTGEKPFTCQICNKSFAKNIHLHNHRKIHSAENPF